MLAGFRPTWALGSAAGIAGLPVIANIKILHILGEVNDGGANERAAETCAVRWSEAGSTADIIVIEPLVGGDMNDLWCEVKLHEHDQSACSKKMKFRVSEGPEDGQHKNKTNGSKHPIGNGVTPAIARALRCMPGTIRRLPIRLSAC